MPPDRKKNTMPDWFVELEPSSGVESYGRERPPTRCKMSSLGDLIAQTIDAFERGVKPTIWTVADEPCGNFDFSPGSLMTIGAPHNGKKTALVIDAIGKLFRRYPDLHFLVASNDMTSGAITQRFMANVLGVSLADIRQGVFEFTRASETVKSLLESLQNRITLVDRPFTMAELTEVVRETGPGIVFLDTLQATDLGQHYESQQRHVAVVMRGLRAVADTGACVVATSALSRSGVAATRERAGRLDVNPLDMACFAHGHEVEEESDVLLLLLAEKGEQLSLGPDKRQEPVKMFLQCVKSRNSVKTILPLWFDGTTQRFSLRTLDENEAQSGKRKYSAKRDGSGSERQKSVNQAHGNRAKKNGTRWLD